MMPAAEPAAIGQARLAGWGVRTAGPACAVRSQRDPCRAQGSQREICPPRPRDPRERSAPPEPGRSAPPDPEIPERDLPPPDPGIPERDLPPQSLGDLPPQTQRSRREICPPRPRDPGERSAPPRPRDPRERSAPPEPGRSAPPDPEIPERDLPPQTQGSQREICPPRPRDPGERSAPPDPEIPERDLPPPDPGIPERDLPPQSLGDLSPQTQRSRREICPPRPRDPRERSAPPDPGIPVRAVLQQTQRPPVPPTKPGIPGITPKQLESSSREVRRPGSRESLSRSPWDPAISPRRAGDPGAGRRACGIPRDPPARDPRARPPQSRGAGNLLQGAETRDPRAEPGTPHRPALAWDRGAAMKLVLWLLSMALSHHGAGGFLVHLATECPLAANGSVLWFSFTFVFNKNPLVCYNDRDRLFEACDMGLLHDIAVRMATQLNADPDWSRRMAGGRQACQSQSQRLWSHTGQRKTPPSVRIVSTDLSNPAGTTRLTCHVWGFYPAEVLVTWLRNGSPVEPTENGLSPALANGDWTYQTQLSLLTAPKPGDTYTCLVQHASLPEPHQEQWGPGLSPGLTVKVSVAVVVLILGLILLGTGMVFWWRAPAPGYSPLPGHNYAGGST
ncbi:unnamed protein product [Natator depressus]